MGIIKYIKYKIYVNKLLLFTIDKWQLLYKYDKIILFHNINFGFIEWKFLF